MNIDLDKLIAEIKSEFPNFTVIPKADSLLMKWINLFMLLISFGKNQFMDDYITTIGTTVYSNNGWDGMKLETRATVLRHERIHMRQQKRYTWPLFAFLYLFPFFPVCFAYFRARMELEAYAETVRADLDYYGTNVIWSDKYKSWLVSQFTGPGYCWMFIFPKTVEKWINAAIDDAVNAKFGVKK